MILIKDEVVKMGKFDKTIYKNLCKRFGNNIA
jgi:hypothetical protein